MADTTRQADADRELLGLAAKAAGYAVIGDLHPADAINILINGRPWSWRPLTDDGDALRLAVALDINVSASTVKCSASWWVRPAMTELEFATVLTGSDKNAATRRAIVMAAAEIGRNHHG